MTWDERGRPVTGLSEQDKRGLFAHHEAGHAVIGAQHGIQAVYVGLAGAAGVPDGSGGYTAWSTASVKRTCWLELAWGCAAGERAADRWLRDRDLWTPGRGWIMEYAAHGDRTFADDTAQGLPDPFAVTWGETDLPDDWSVICDQVDELLADSWPLVATLASQLLEHDRIEGEHVAELAATGDDAATT